MMRSFLSTHTSAKAVTKTASRMDDSTVYVLSRYQSSIQLQQQGKPIMYILSVATLATLLFIMTVTQQAFATTNLNSSKSNIYRNSQNAQANEGGSVEQQST
ncbi:MAG: hypothetical protein ACRD8Z_12620, partial [Nitrososphaeraceae archaeon]